MESFGLLKRSDEPMEEGKRYSINEYPTAAPLDRTDMGFHLEFGVENLTDQPIAVMRANGEIYIVQPALLNPIYPKDVKVQMIITTGAGCSFVPSYLERPIKTDLPFTIKEFTLKYNDLRKGPIVVPEVECTFGFQRDLEAMRQKNTLNVSYFNAMFKAQLEDWQKHPEKIFPLCVKANSTKYPLKTLFIDINGCTLEVGVTSNPNLNDGMEISVFTPHGWKTYYILDIDWSRLTSEHYIIKDDFEWTIATSIEAMDKYRFDKKEAERQKLSGAEVAKAIKEKCQPYEDEIAALKAQLEAQKRLYELERQKSAALQVEVDKIHGLEKASLEQQQLAAKLANLQEENKILQEKRVFTKEVAEIEEKQRAAKADADYRVAEAKVSKESLALAGAEVSNIGTTLKTVAVALPIAAGVALWAAKASAASVVPTAVAVSPIGGAIAVGAAVAGAATIVIKSAASVVRNTYNTMSNAIRRAWDNVCDWVSSWW